MASSQLKSSFLSFLLLLVTAHGLSVEARDSRFKLWQKISSPTGDSASALGGYSGGCLLGAQALPLEGPGFVMMQPKLNRNFAHPEMIQYLEQLGQSLQAAGAPSMLVEDIAGPRGGPVASGHASHQNGLDVDISLFMANAENLPSREKIISHSMVNALDKTKLRSDWQENQQPLLVSLAADHPKVERIFVAPAIKQYFCDKFPTAPWLHKLRPMQGHDDHIHVRLACPRDSLHCESQEPVEPASDQCGTSLKASYSGWKTGILISGAASVDSEVEMPYPKLPKACLNLLEKTN